MDMFVRALRLEGISDIRVLALPLALVLSGLVQAVLLAIFLRRRFGRILHRELYIFVLKTGVACLALSLTAYGILQIYGKSFALVSYIAVLGQFLFACFGGCMAYIGAALLMRSKEAEYVASICKLRLHGKR